MVFHTELSSQGQSTKQCDARQGGLGAVILQNSKPIEYTSCSLTNTETQYTEIEKEMLAIVFALEGFNQYTFVQHVHIESDHRPLEMILLKPLVQAPQHLQLMMMLKKYDFTMHHERDKNMHLANILSRAYLPYKGKEDDFVSVNMVCYLPISDQHLDKIRAETRRDQSLRELLETILIGWPENKEDAPALIHPYFSMCNELTVQDGLVFKGSSA